MKRRDFSFELPDALIARHPPAQRGDSRLLQLDGASGALRHGHFSELPGLLHAGDLLVLNDTRVLAARLLGEKADTGGRAELLLERVLSPTQAWVHLKTGRPKTGLRLRLQARQAGMAAVEAVLRGRQDDLFLLELATGDDWFAVLETHGHMPLPPYLGRDADVADGERYQTVYAREQGAVAAPTAGLHFDAAMLQCLRDQGVETAFLTLHVGAGTFQPLRVDDIREHRMHRERLRVDAAVCEAVQRARERGGRVVAVGTTVVRALESAAAGGSVQPFDGETDIFITPGYRFRVVDALLTNFHLPESTLLMLVSAFAGHSAVMAAYAEAVREQYRFFSYGDACFFTRAPFPTVPEAA